MTRTGVDETSPSDATLAELEGLCRRLRLRYIREEAPDVLRTAKAQRWDPAELLRVLLIAEAEGRDRSTTEHRRKQARLPTGKTFEGWDAARSSIPAVTQRALRSLEWVDRHENVVVAGPSGTGKSHLCEALGHAAISAGRRVLWFSVEDLGALVRRHRVDDSVAKAFTPILRADLVAVDDIGMLPLSADAAEGLYRLVDTAYERRSLAVSTNLHPSGFDQLMDPTIATVLLGSSGASSTARFRGSGAMLEVISWRVHHTLHPLLPLPFLASRDSGGVCDLRPPHTTTALTRCFLRDPNRTTALVDRLLHHAHVLVTNGDSIRLADALTGKGVTPLA